MKISAQEHAAINLSGMTRTFAQQADIVKKMRESRNTQPPSNIGKRLYFLMIDAAKYVNIEHTIKKMEAWITSIENIMLKDNRERLEVMTEEDIETIVRVAKRHIQNYREYISST